jgi:DNA-binding CsgD family transcriptional regulator
MGDTNHEGGFSKGHSSTLNEPVVAAFRKVARVVSRSEWRLATFVGSDVSLGWVLDPGCYEAIAAMKGTFRETTTGSLTEAAALIVMVPVIPHAHPLKGVSISRQRSDPGNKFGLTEREMNVLELLAGGFSMERIGSQLGVRPRTARNHLQNAMDKMDVHSRVDALATAIRHGVIHVTEPIQG